MMISTKGRYALRIMVDVAQHDGEMPVSVREIAQRQDISGKYMEQIISVLTRSGLLRSIPKLNEKEHKKLVPIEGTPVDMLNPPKGCPFAPRCGSCMKICLREMPAYTDISDVHYSACWLLQKEEFEKGGNA